MSINLDDIIKTATAGEDSSVNSSVTVASGKAATTKSSSGFGEGGV